MGLQVFSRISILAIICGMFLSCSENLEQDTPSITLKNLDLSGLSIELNPIVIDLDEYALDQLIKDLSIELYEINLSEYSKSMKLPINQKPSIGFSILLDGDKNQALITPLNLGADQSSENSRITNSDDSTLCGGQTGDGWTSYGTCSNQNCVTEMMLAAADDLGEPGVGQCLDLRVVRTLFSARVCGRLTSCT